MKVYVASSVRNVDAVKLVQKLVLRAGHEITFDWTPMVEQWGGNVATTPRYVRQEAAIRDRRGVLDADLMIALGHPRLTGTLWECGMAAAGNARLWLVFWKECSRHSIFEDLPNVDHIDTLDQLKEALRLAHHATEIEERTYRGKIAD